MAVGAVSSLHSQHAVQGFDPAAVIRSGESLGTSQEALQDPNSKTYYHSVAGAKFIMPDGLEVVFMGGQLTTNDPAIIQQLDAIANKPASLVFTKRESLATVSALQRQAAEAAADTAGKAAA